MPNTVESSGTQASTPGTEHTVASPTDAKTRIFIVDVGNMVAGDALFIRVKRKVLTGGTVRLQYYMPLINVPGEVIIETPPVTCTFGAAFSIQQIGGATRNYDWSVVTIN